MVRKKYVIVGAGGTGGVVGAKLNLSGHDVTFIARGEHMRVMRERTLRLIENGVPIDVMGYHVCEAKDYEGSPDYIFICVKSYSLNDEILDLISRSSVKSTVVLPLLNVYGTGDYLREKLPDEICVLDGCIYINAYISAPGEVTMVGNTCKIVFGVVDRSPKNGLLTLDYDLSCAGIETKMSGHIKEDCFEKFTVISPFAAAGSYYDMTAGQLRDNPVAFSDVIAMAGELGEIAKAMGLKLTFDVAEHTRESMLSRGYDIISSMHRDIKNGHASEVDGLVFEPVRMGKRLGVPTPVYLRIARSFGYTDID